MNTLTSLLEPKKTDKKAKFDQAIAELVSNGNMYIPKELIQAKFNLDC